MTETVADYPATNGSTPLTAGGLPAKPAAKTTSKKVPPEPDELEVLFPEVPVSTKLGKFIVSPFVFKDFKRVLALVKKYSDLIAAQPDANLFNLIVANAEDGMEDAIAFIQLCCPITDKQIQTLRFDNVVDLFMTAVEVNRDFLLLRLQESGLRSTLVTSAATNGATSSAN
jgi:hypothetical protein